MVMQSFSYGEDERQRLDVYSPRSRPRGVMIFDYGGSWRDGSRRYYRFVGSIFSRRGFVVVIPDYRVFPQVRFPGFMEDAAAAVRWTLDHADRFGGDADKLTLMGHSAGAHIGALLLTNPAFLGRHGLVPDVFKRFVGISGPYSFNPLDYQSTAEIFATANPIATARPIKNVSGAEPPMLLLHGGEDKTVYPVNTINLARAVTDAGGRARSIVYPRLGHKGTLLSLVSALRWRAPVLSDIDGFVSGDNA